MVYILFVVVVALVTGWLGSYVASEKNRSSSEGFWLGFLFSFVGVLIVGMLPTKEKPKKKELSPEQLEKRKESLKKHDAIMNRVLIILGIIMVVVIIVAIYFK